MGLGLGIMLALIFAAIGGVLGAARFTKEPSKMGAGFGINFLVDLFILFFFDWLALHYGRPMLTFPVGLILIVFINILVVAITATVTDIGLESVSLSSILSWVGVVVLGIVWIAGVNSGHNAYKASHLFPVTSEGTTSLIASSNAQLVAVDADVATTRASQDMTSGIAGQRNYSTYLQLGPATLQLVDNQMEWVFPLEFDGSGAKQRLHAIIPGYIMVSATDPNAAVVDHYDNQYSMIIGLGAGQGGEPDRWAYDHGYSGYILDDPTLEINEQGLPFYTLSLLRPKLGWTFDAPVGVLVINAHTGQITRYAIGQTPSWVDRVFSQQDAINLATWYGKYGEASFSGTTNANRFQVDGTPYLTYTGGGHPIWRVLLSSFNSDIAVSRILDINSATGAMQVYIPAGAMGVEGSAEDAFNNGSGVGATSIRANHLVVDSLALHVIYGHLTWMADFVSEGVSNPTFVGVGFLDAYNPQSSNVAFGSTRASALQSYLTQLSVQGNANGTAPGQGSQTETITGKIALTGWDVIAGQKYEYFTLVGSPGTWYEGTVTNLGPEILAIQPGQKVTLSVNKVDVGNSTEIMNSFTDTTLSTPLGG